MKNHRKVIYAEIPAHHTYNETWDFQKHLQQKLIRKKREGWTGEPGYLLLCEHSPVYTLGKSGKFEHLKVSITELQDQKTEFFKINRGGDITFHGPGQITGYPILDLDQYYNDAHRYVRELEEVVIRTIAEFEVEGTRRKEYTGVWIRDHRGDRKICAIGVHMSRWVTMHGFALNVHTDLDFFDQIIPCGIKESKTSVTSITKETGKAACIDEVRKRLKKHFSDVFGFTYLPAPGK